MIGKQTKGTSFGGCVRYVLKEEKSKLLEAAGVDGTPEQMAEQFELQALLNDKVKNIVGHTSLNFSPEDGERLKSDDALMLQIAHDYMKLMGIENTQYIIARHSIRIATSFSIVWTMTVRRLATRTTSTEMKRCVRC
mgnify:CR=1 FL=1